MKEIFDRRKTEMEIAAKNTIVEIYLIREKQKEIEKVLKVNEEYLRSLNAAIQELENVNMEFKKEEEKNKDQTQIDP